MPQRKRWVLTWGDLFFDVFSTSLSVIDLLSDVFVSSQFYEEGEMFFFWASMFIFLAAQCAYTIQFEMLFQRGNETFCVKSVRCIIVFIFAQLVPLLVWLHHKTCHFNCVHRFVDFLGLELHHAQYKDPHGDPLVQYLAKKWHEHLGFVIEAVVEAVPQSLLQMAYIIARGKASPLNVFSIVSSLVTICSKGFLMTYSIHPVMMLFGVFCFCADVTGVFATAAFLSQPFTTSHTVPIFELEIPYASYLWIIKEISLFSCMAILGLIMLGMLAFEPGEKLDWQKSLYLVALFCAGILFFIPAAIFLEGAKLFGVYIIFFGPQLRAQREFPAANRVMWAFIQGRPFMGDDKSEGLLIPGANQYDMPDFDRKIRALNLVASQQAIDSCGGKCVSPKCRYYYQQKCKNALQIRRTALRKDKKDVPAGFWFMYAQYIAYIQTAIAVASLDRTWKSVGTASLVVLVFGVVGPVYVLGNVYCLFYPLLCLFTMDNKDLLQTVFGGLYVLSLVGLLLCVYSLPHFFRYLLRVKYAVHKEVALKAAPGSASLARVLQTYAWWRKQEYIYRLLHLSETFPLCPSVIPYGYCTDLWTSGNCKNFKFCKLRHDVASDREMPVAGEEGSEGTSWRLCLTPQVFLGPVFPREICLLILHYCYDTIETPYKSSTESKRLEDVTDALCFEDAPPLHIEC